jgi:hypothetical protein
MEDSSVESARRLAVLHVAQICTAPISPDLSMFARRLTRYRLAIMQIDPSVILRLFFGLCFLGTIAGGVLVLKNYEKLFGPDPNVPGETSGARAYGKLQALVVLLHALILFGAFAFL